MREPIFDEIEYWMWRELLSVMPMYKRIWWILMGKKRFDKHVSKVYD